MSEAGGPEAEGGIDGQVIRAAIHSARAVGAAPEDVDARLALAASLGALHLHADELPELRWLAARQPNDPELAMVLEHALSHMGRDEEALEIARRVAMAAGPDADVLALAQPALALRRLGRVDEAVAELESLTARIDDPEDRAVPLGLLAELLEEQDRHDEAIARLREAAELAPGEGYDWACGNLLRELGRVEEAAERFAAEVEADPDDAYAMRDWGVCLAEMGEAEEAERILTRAEAAAPLVVGGEAAAARARLRLEAGRAGEAVLVLHDAIERDPLESDLRRVLADVLEALGRESEAAWERRQAERLNEIAGAD
jgi:tetratricopeptide (TPR) repeat protein